MKKIVLKIAFVAVVTYCGSFASANLKKGNIRISDLTLNNIEALAQEEEIPNKVICFRRGDLDCWDGSKAEYIAIMRSLDLD